MTEASIGGKAEPLARPTSDDVMMEAELDALTQVTNGCALPQESKDEIKEFLDTDDQGNLTFAGFLEMYHLQSDNEPEETWKDLVKLGFDQTLEYVPPTREAETG